KLGCPGLSARRLAEHAEVNLGMFHYHFRSKENFIRTLLGRLYEQMFSALTMKIAEDGPPRDNLRNALLVLGQFAIAHRLLLLRIVGDAMAGEAVAEEFLRTNIPRHVGILISLIGAAQTSGEITAVPIAQVLAFLGGSIAAPILMGSALAERDALPPVLKGVVELQVLSEAALIQRIEFALKGLSV
ncbi:MAG TPA: TetR/AcrR family transcriptional regulator, partial [Burkholderiaceae bacterium]